MSGALEAAAATALPLVFLVSLRVGVILALMPPPFSTMTPISIRAVLTLWIAGATALPLDLAPPASHEPLLLVGAGLGEIMVGSVIGLTVRVTLAAVEIAGTVAGFSMGLGFATSVDPTLGEATLPTTRLLGYFGALIFLVFEGHHAVVGAIVTSLQLAPPGAVMEVFASEAALGVGSSMLARGLQIAAPVVATMFIVQLGTALVARAAPRVQLFSLTFAVAVTIGLLSLFAAAPTIARAIGIAVRGLPSALADVLGVR
ncbi:MAG: flagellar biosynthetic protein FliR [Myxococcales bacterium]|nr:flagellar biosynthetic protein FliR [Myxococcales bacterium]